MRNRAKTLKNIDFRQNLPISFSILFISGFFAVAYFDEHADRNWILGGSTLLNVLIFMGIPPKSASNNREEQYRSFINHAPMAVAMLDTDRNYLAVSNRLYSEYNLDRSRSLIGKKTSQRPLICLFFNLLLGAYCYI